MQPWTKGVLFAAATASVIGAIGCAPSTPEAVTPTRQSPTLPPAVATARPQKAHEINPLSGLPVADLDLLKIPAVLISVSHFPATARPQAGLSFAPFVYEFYITEGTTRFLAVFHGEWPAMDSPVRGGCETRVAPFSRTKLLLGNRVWFDANANGLQDPGEGGIAGLCVNLYDETDELVARSTTDSNGYYGFNLDPGEYSLEFVPADGLEFTLVNAGDDAIDSDAHPGSGRVRVDMEGDDLSVDAGMTSAVGGAATPTAELSPPLAQVGPIRSGRLIYRHIARYFQDSCLVYASASPEVLERLPKCAVVFHQILGGGFMLDLSELWSVANENKRRARSEFDYSGNLFAELPAPFGMPATALRVYIAYQNQSGWFYDPLTGSYVRYVDTSEPDNAGVLYPETDRLTGRQLQVQNLIVLFAKHEVISPTNLDIRLDPGRTGKAMLFRDGMKLDIDWRTSRDAEGDPRGPIQFLQKNGELAPLKPGHTWVIVVTPETTVEADGEGQWQLTFFQPPGAK
jgi:hypothetical protein